MPLYAEVLHRHRTRDGAKDHVLVLYRQPLHRHVISVVYHWWDMRPWRWLSGLDLVSRAWHRRGCDGDCASGRTPTGEEVTMCGYIPLTARQDLRCYDLGHRDRSRVISITLTDQQCAECTDELCKP